MLEPEDTTLRNKHHLGLLIQQSPSLHIYMV